MKNNVLRFSIATVIFLLISVGTVYSQSKYLEDGHNGSGAELELSYNSSELSRITGTLGFSIASMMDVGFIYGKDFTTFMDTDTEETIMGLSYNMMVLKQKQLNPVNIQLLGSYTFSTVDTPYLNSTNFIREGQGYVVGISAFHDLLYIPFSEYATLRIGGLGTYSSYKYSNQNLPEDLSQDEIDQINEQTGKNQTISYGFQTLVNLKLLKTPIISIGIQMLNSEDIGKTMKTTFAITMPSL